VAVVTKEAKESDTALKGSASHLGVAGEGISKIMMQRTVPTRGETYVVRRDSKMPPTFVILFPNLSTRASSNGLLARPTGPLPLAEILSARCFPSSVC
jgi:hypothetical protein